MNLTEYEASLYHLLYDTFEAKGYEMHYGYKQFRKCTPAGFQNIILTFTSYQNELWVEVHLGSRIEAIEQIAQQFLENSKGYQSQANTIITSVGKLNQSKYFRYKIYNGEDVKLVANEVLDFMESKGYGFLKRASNIAQVEELFNKLPKKTCPYVYNQSHRCFKGAVASKLVGSKHFERLMPVYADTIKLLGNPREIKNFQKLSDFLFHYTPN